MFLNINSFDNTYITDDLREYDLEQVKDGAESIFPLYEYETKIYLSRTSLFCSLNELISITLILILDLSMLCYITILFIIDLSLYAFALILRELILNLANDFNVGPEDFKMEQVPKFFFWKIKVNEKESLEFIELLKAKMISCAPKPFPVDFGSYKKCYNLCACILFFTLLKPLMNRTRSYACSRIYPERIRPRTKWLYNRIIFNRIILSV